MGPLANHNPDTTTPAAELRAAATRLRETAKGLPPHLSRPAGPLADWMEDAAEDLSGAMVVASKWPDGENADPMKYCDQPDSVRHALAVAREINGGRS